MKGGNDQELQYADVKRPSRDVQPQAEMGGYGQITFSEHTDKPPSGRGAVQRGQEVEYGEIKFAERPQQKNRLKGPAGSPQGTPQVEYGEIKFVERPQQKNRLMGPAGSPQGATQVEYGEIKLERPRMAR